MQTLLTSSSDEKYIRCPRCGIRVTKRELSNHLIIKHGMIYGAGLPAFVMFDDIGNKKESGENGRN